MLRWATRSGSLAALGFVWRSTVYSSRFLVFQTTDELAFHGSEAPRRAVLRNVLRLLRPRTSWLVVLDKNLWFHQQIAYMMLFWTVVHITAHYVNMSHVRIVRARLAVAYPVGLLQVETTQVRKEAAWQILFEQRAGITGHVMLVIMFLM